jgi:hypothetical protein
MLLVWTITRYLMRLNPAQAVLVRGVLFLSKNFRTLHNRDLGRSDLQRAKVLEL